MEHIEAEHPRPRHFLLHLSDPHLLGGPDPLYGVVDSEARLIQLFEEVKASGARPEAVIFTGDLADKGEPERLRQASRDRRTRLRRARCQGHLGDGQPRQPRQLPDGPAGPARAMTPGGQQLLHQRAARDHHGHHGAGVPPRGTERVTSWSGWPRNWRRPAPDGTILALHHPPVPSVLDLSVLVELRDQASLAAWSGTRTSAPSWPGTCTTRPPPASPVSRCRWPRPRCYTQDLNVPVGARAARTAARPSTSCTSTSTRSCTRWCRWEARRPWASTSPAEETARRLAAAGVRIPETREAAAPARGRAANTRR